MLNKLIERVTLGKRREIAIIPESQVRQYQPSTIVEKLEDAYITYLSTLNNQIADTEIEIKLAQTRLEQLKCALFSVESGITALRTARNENIEDDGYELQD